MGPLLRRCPPLVRRWGSGTRSRHIPGNQTGWQRKFAEGIALRLVHAPTPGAPGMCLFQRYPCSLVCQLPIPASLSCFTSLRSTTGPDESLQEKSPPSSMTLSQIVQSLEYIIFLWASTRKGQHWAESFKDLSGLVILPICLILASFPLGPFHSCLRGPLALRLTHVLPLAHNQSVGKPRIRQRK